MTSHHSATFPCYRLALHMNNLGVSLLEKGCYEEAIRTLKDSVQILKGVCRRHCNKEASTAAANHNREVDLKVQKACKRFAKSHVTCSRDQAKAGRVLQTVFYEDNFIPFLHQGNELPVGCLRPTRIEFADFAAVDPADRDVGLDFIILLCNYGIASFLLSTKKKGSDASVLHGLSLNAFRVAMSNITDRYSACEDDIEEAGVMSVAVLVMGNLSQVNMEMGRRENAIVLYNKCLQMKDSMQRSEAADWISLLSNCVSSVAAAA